MTARDMSALGQKRTFPLTTVEWPLPGATASMDKRALLCLIELHSSAVSV